MAKAYCMVYFINPSFKDGVTASESVLALALIKIIDYYIITNAIIMVA